MKARLKCGCSSSLAAMVALVLAFAPAIAEGRGATSTNEGPSLNDVDVDVGEIVLPDEYAGGLRTSIRENALVIPSEVRAGFSILVFSFSVQVKVAVDGHLAIDCGFRRWADATNDDRYELIDRARPEPESGEPLPLLQFSSTF